MNPKPRFTMPQPPSVKQRLAQQQAQLIELRTELHALRLKLSDAHIREVAVSAYEQEAVRLTTLRDDAVRVLRLLVTTGVITQDQLNAATAPPA